MEEKLTGYHCLAIPGPTNMPFEIRQAMELPLEDHRAPDFGEFTLPLFSMTYRRYLEHKPAECLYFPVPAQVDGNLLLQIR